MADRRASIQSITSIGSDDSLSQILAILTKRILRIDKSTSTEPITFASIATQTENEDEVAEAVEEEDVKEFVTVATQTEDVIISMYEEGESGNNEDGNNTTTSEDGTPEESNVTYLQVLFDLMYYCGMSPFRGNGDSTRSIPHTVYFVVMCVLAILKSVLDLKYYYYTPTENGDLYHSITIGYYTCPVMLLAFYLRAVTRSKTCVPEFLCKLNKLESEVSEKQEKTKVYLLSAVSFGISVFVVLVNTLYLWLLQKGLTPSKILLYKSYKMGRILYFWHTTKNNSTGVDVEDLLDNLYQTYGVELTWTTGIFAIVLIVLDIIGGLFMLFIINMFLMTTVDICKIKADCQSKIESLETSDITEVDKEWPTYLSVYEVTNLANKGFNLLFKVLHIHNVLLCSYFLLDIHCAKTRNISLIASFFLVVKITMAYHFASKVPELNDSYQRAGSNCQINSSNMPDKEKLQILFFFKKLENFEVGLGVAIFFVNEEFVFKILGIIISCFLLFIDK